jgi:YidC/Oxa1 family membrane protein insertase
VPDDRSSTFGLINFLSARQPNPAADSVEVERTALPSLEGEEETQMSTRDNRANLAWIGAKNRFFTAIMSASRETLVDSNGATRSLFAGDPRDLPTAADIKENMAAQPQLQTLREGGGFVTTPAFGETSLTVEPNLVAAGGAYTASYRLYAGPAVDEWMEEADPRMQGVVSYTISYLDFISRWLVRLLDFLHGILGNYGVAIIALTIIIKLVLHPLNRKSFVSMNKMSKLAPKMKEIQTKFASDRVRMQQEIGRLYKENGVSMAGGCLPMFLQLPIFFALYGAFSQGFAMRHAPFLSPWIKDLSMPDMVYDLGWSIPLLNSSYISLLPIVYLGAQYFQMKLQPAPTDPQQAQQQKMMRFMPLIFVFLFYSMPAGLVLYFTVSSLAGIAESVYMRRVVLPGLGMGAMTPEQAAAGAQAGAGAAAVPSADKKKKRRK